MILEFYNASIVPLVTFPMTKINLLTKFDKQNGQQTANLSKNSLWIMSFLRQFGFLNSEIEYLKVTIEIISHSLTYDDGFKTA